MPSFEVSIPCYNYGRYLNDCIRSVLAQDVESLRVLVLDNASTDDSLAVARDLAARDARIEVRAHDRNLGSHASFNEAIDWARGDYFVLLCADDLLVPGALRRAGEVLDTDPALAFCCGRDLAIGERDRPPELNLRAEAPRWHCISGRGFIEDACRRGAMGTPTAAIVVPTQKLKLVGHFPELWLEDHEFWLRLATVGDIAQMENVQASIRYRGGNMALKQSSTQMLLIEQISEAIDRSSLTRAPDYVTAIACTASRVKDWRHAPIGPRLQHGRGAARAEPL